MRYLGIDYGTKKVGLALSDESGLIANPHSAVANNASFLDNLLTLIQKEDIGAVVLGESKDYKGEENPVMSDIYTLKKKLEEKGIEVSLEPEYLTSMEAERHEGGMTDASAAAIILQSYLDRIKK
jgi:putative Holliday junction resolvase